MRARPTPRSCAPPASPSLQRYQGIIHDFVMVNALRDTHAAKAATAQGGDFLRAALHDKPSSAWLNARVLLHEAVADERTVVRSWLTAADGFGEVARFGRVVDGR
jgi:hypothetical protein